MVQNKKTRSRPKPDNGSPSKGRSDPERPADKRDTRISRPRQGGAQSFNSNRKAGGRLAAAVILQSLKDMCQGSDAGEDEILDWSSSDSFETVCKSAGMDAGMVRELIKEMHGLPYRVRKDFLISRIRLTTKPE